MSSPLTRIMDICRQPLWKTFSASWLTLPFYIMKKRAKEDLKGLLLSFYYVYACLCGRVHTSVHEEQRECSLDMEWQEGVGQDMAGVGADPDPLKNRKHSYLLSTSPAHNNSALRAGSQLNFIFVREFILFRLTIYIMYLKNTPASLIFRPVYVKMMEACLVRHAP